jgi:hypothetical protein
MRADIHDGSEHNTLQSEAGYIDARPHTRQIEEILLQRTAGPYIGVKTRIAVQPNVSFRQLRTCHSIGSVQLCAETGLGRVVHDYRLRHKIPHRSIVSVVIDCAQPNLVTVRTIGNA